MRGFFLLLAPVALMAGCIRQPQGAGQGENGAQEKADIGGVGMAGKVLMVVAPSDFRDEELFSTQLALEKRGYSVEVASTKKGSVRGARGGVANATLLASEAKAEDYAAVAFVGGPGVEEHALDENASILKLAKDASAKGKVVGAICIGPRIIAAAGIVSGKKVTSFPDNGTKSMLTNAGANYIGGAVVTDGKLVTADGPGSAVKFGEALADAIEGR